MAKKKRVAIAPKTSDDWIEAIYTQFAHESDRAAAIVAAAMIDEALKALLEARLRSPREGCSSITARYAPLEAFGARINAAYQLGLISKYMAKDLETTEKIRNTFLSRIA